MVGSRFFKGNNTMFKFLKKHWTEILLGLMFLSGVLIIAYPKTSDMWNQSRQNRSIDTYKESVQNKSQEEKKEMIEKAVQFNKIMQDAGGLFALDQKQKEEYYACLDITGTGIMGYIDIPSINVHLPVYHGTSEEALRSAAGHLEGSSLPVASGGSHSVISGHRGLPSALLFTYLDRLETGDRFSITILDEVFTYKIDDIKTVFPEDVSGLTIENGKDYTTLVTCTPYGVNTHRLLIRGILTDNDEEEKEIIETKDANRIMPKEVFPYFFYPILILILIWFIFSDTQTTDARKALKNLQENAEKRKEGKE